MHRCKRKTLFEQPNILCTVQRFKNLEVAVKNVNKCDEKEKTLPGIVCRTGS